MAIGWITLGVNVASGLMKAGGKKKAAKQQKKMGQQAYDATMAETEETLRRMDESFEDWQGKATQTMGASGFGFGEGTSQSDYMNKASESYQTQRDWTESAGLSQAKAAKKSGQMQSDQLQSSGRHDLFSSSAKGVFGLGEDKGWWT